MRYLFLLLFTGSAALAQNRTIDSLKNQLTKLPADTNRVKTLEELAMNLRWNGLDSMARLRLEEAVRLAKRVNYVPGEIRARLTLVLIESDYQSDSKSAYVQLDTAWQKATAIGDLSLQGQVFFRRSQMYANIERTMPMVYPSLEKALQKFKQAKDQIWEAKAYSEMGIVRAGQGNFVDAIDLLLRARKIQEFRHDLKGLRATLPNLTAMYLEIRRYNEALTYLNEAEKLANQLNDQVVKVFVMGRRAAIMEKKGQYPQALALYLQQAAALENPYQPASLSRAYGSIGRMYIQLKQYDKALKYSNLSQKVYRETVEETQDVLEHSAQTNLGNIYLALGQYRRAVACADTGLHWIENIEGMRSERREYLRQLAEGYDKLGQPAKALAYYKRYKAQADTILNEEVQQKATIAGMTYDFEKKQQAVRLKQAEQAARIQSLENDKLGQTRNFLVALLAAIAGILAYVFWSNRQLKVKNEQLSQKNAEIEAALYQGQTIERKRVASELHDSVASKVSALKWRFEAFDTAQFDAAQHAEHARLLDHLGEVYEDIRTISHNLIPEILEKKGLQAALIKLTDTLNTQNRIRFLLEVDQAGTAIRGKTAYELYAITLELVNNIMKHAKAKQADIALSRQPGMLDLTVQDDGQGMGPGINGEGIGLKNISSRLDRLGGSCRISNPAQGGTRVNIQIPLAG